VLLEESVCYDQCPTAIQKMKKKNNRKKELSPEWEAFSMCSCGTQQCLPEQSS